MEKLQTMATVFHQPNKDFQSNPPDSVETTIAHGMIILNLSFQNLSKIYSALASRFLSRFLNLTNICLCFDIKNVPISKMLNKRLWKQRNSG